MVFTGIPVFLDPPNWQQDQPGGGSGSATIRGGSLVTAAGGDGGSLAADNPPISMLHPPPSELVPTTMVARAGSTIRPTLMADRARLAKVPPPDTAVKCPRCESANTKFCYYNNYSLSQPRHFCKTCRRYWTNGGALRNVPVGGGCRRNKRNKSSSNSGSNRSQAMETSSATSSGGATVISSGNCTGEIVGIDNHPHFPVLPFLSSIHGFSDYGSGTATGLAFTAGRDLASSGSGNFLGLNFMAANEHAESSNLGQWRMQQHFPAIPFHRAENLVHIEPQLLPPYDGEGLIEHQYLATAVAQLKTNTPSNLSQSTAPVKLENNQSQNLAYMNSNGWGDFSKFPSTTGSLL